MHPSNSVYAQKLYSVTIENVTVGLLLDHKTKEDTCSVLPGIPFDSMRFNTMHQHAYVELFVCLQGQLTVGTEQGELVLSAGDAAFIPIGLMHCKKQDGNGAQYRVIGMTFTRRYPKNSFNLYRVMMKFCCEDNILLLRGRQSFCESVAALFDAADGDPYLPAMRLAMLLAETARELR
ncbi:MAG: cupin domain-containing protein, partial [Clostridia bacterium]|nr:cupin domain-containing protein [Clostridia bacterium]